MPAYEYDCAQCGTFTVLCPMDARNEPKVCPDCETSAPRVIQTAPAFAGMAAASRIAHATNERAAHEPKLKSKHGAGCSCCSSSGNKTSTTQAANGLKAFANKRPWMISH